jgi:hypothetical protein
LFFQISDFIIDRSKNRPTSDRQPRPTVFQFRTSQAIALSRNVGGESGATIYARLEALYTQPKTPAKLKAHINFFLIERLHGRAPQRVEVDGGTSLLELLADVVGRDRSEADR